MPDPAHLWPPFQLSLRLDELALRVVRDEDVPALFELLEQGIVPPGQEHRLPRLLLGRAPTPKERFWALQQYHWGVRSEFSLLNWHLAFVVVQNGAVIGSQSMRAKEFTVLRSVSTGSYLSASAQGQGIGTRMRAMALEFAFGSLGALSASSGYHESNEASRRVSAKLGYELAGVEFDQVEGRRQQVQRVQLLKERWEQCRPAYLDRLEVHGLTQCAPMLGAAGAED